MGEKLKVILAQVNTWLVAAGLVVTIVAAEVAPLLDDDRQRVVAQLAATVLGWLGAAAAIIRRTTEVPGSVHGILMPPRTTLEVEVTHPGGVTETRTVR